jgi:GNAT superfamily N-acetyltransferase
LAATGLKTPAVSVRAATIKDASRISQLSAQLGYSTSPEDVERRLRLSGQNPENVIYVATLPDGHVMGWIHVFVYRSIESDARVEIAGLVVDERHRRSGAGRQLIQYAELWARELGCSAVNLRTNVVRKDAHAFYETLGFILVKTQHAYRKNL